MTHRRIIAAGLAAGVLCHILQGASAYFLLDRFFLENPDLIRSSSRLVGFYYLGLNLLIGLTVSYLSFFLKSVFDGPDWKIGIKAALFLWAASSPVFIIRRQILFDLSDWLYLEIISDFTVYIIIGAVAGYLSGRGIVDK